MQKLGFGPIKKKGGGGKIGAWKPLAKKMPPREGLGISRCARAVRGRTNGEV